VARRFLSKSRLISAWSERARALTNKAKWMVALAGLLTMTMSVLAADLAPMLTFESEYPLGDTKVYAIYSEEAGRDLQMMVSLPGDYDSSGPETHYPVLYTVDGQWNHALLGVALEI
jgi:enterochelin esterase-like enzyme